MEIRLLGPVRASVRGQQLNVGVRQQRFVLAVLALEVNRLVTVDRLIDLTWPDDPPIAARRVIHSQISRLRATLAPAGRTVQLRREGAGYLLACEPIVVDAHRFVELIAEARRIDDTRERLAGLDEALALWRGPALLGTASEETRTLLCGHLDQARLSAIEDRLETLLRQGSLDSVVDQATQLCGEHPHRHRFTAALMGALHRSGRSADALAVYQRTKHRLADELGLDPPTELRNLQLTILRDTGDSTASQATSQPSEPVRPAQLPADVSSFTGRAAELNDLRANWPARSSAVVINALDGMAGVGKTALAIHAAHELAGQFPDGQLFLDLHGHTENMAPVEPGDALDRLLRALGIPGERIPDHLDDRAALFRTVLAGRQVLVVLDNAATEAQVRPLLPGTPGCLVLITSRRRLAGLDDVHAIPVDLLPLSDAVALFAVSAGLDRVAGAPAEVLAHIADLCGRLPLAIRIAAARLRAHPAWTPAYLAERLGDHRHRLAELQVTQRSIATALDLSYHHLGAEQQRAYRLLGLHPGAVIDVYETAALCDATSTQANRLLDDLLDAHLLTEPAPGQYTFHDLTRAHAVFSCAEHEPQADQRSALTRLFNHYARTAAAAMDIAYPYQTDYRSYLTPTPDHAETPAPTFADADQATAWLDTSMTNLFAAASHAAEQDWPSYVINLSATLHHHLRARARFTHALALHNQALDVARRTGHSGGQLSALVGLGEIHGQHAHHDRLTATQAALALARDIGHRVGELNALRILGHIHRHRGEYELAINAFEQALAVAQDINHRGGELHALYGLGTVHRVQGNYEASAECDLQALAIARDTGNRGGELHAFYGLGNTYQLRGQLELATDYFQQGLALARDIGHRGAELYLLHGLGNVHQARADYDQALDHYQQALALAEQNGDPNGKFEALHGLGRTHHFSGQPEAALDCLRTALHLADDLGQPSDQARGHHSLALALRAHGHTAQARLHWHHTLTILTNLGITQTEEVNIHDIQTHLADLA